MRATYFKIVSLTLVILLAGSIHRAVPLGMGVKTHGLDLAGMDKSVNPGDDFFSYANGTWIKTTPIPDDRSSYGIFDILAEEANRRTADLIKEASASARDTEARQIGDYYAAYMDEKAIEDKSLSPLKAELQAMVKNIILAFGRRIDNLAWMSPATRSKKFEHSSESGGVSTRW